MNGSPPFTRSTRPLAHGVSAPWNAASTPAPSGPRRSPTTSCATPFTAPHHSRTGASSRLPPLPARRRSTYLASRVCRLGGHQSRDVAAGPRTAPAVRGRRRGPSARSPRRGTHGPTTTSWPAGCSPSWRRIPPGTCRSAIRTASGAYLGDRDLFLFRDGNWISTRGGEQTARGVVAAAAAWKASRCGRLLAIRPR
jgi:hypothetical protein